jgi:hypothetical protein
MATAGTIWHTIRHADGTWQNAFGLVEGQEANDPGQFTSIGCGGTGTELQIAGVAQFAQVWHTLREETGAWQPTFGLVGSDIQQRFPSIDCAGVGTDLQVVVVDGMNDGGPIEHTIRHANGSWQPGFGDVGGDYTQVSCAGVGVELQVVGIAKTGQLWHTIRHADGTWQPAFGLIEGQEQNNPGFFAAVGCAGVGVEMQLVGVAGGQLWHTIRNSDGTWQPTFGLVESQEENNPGAFTFVSCAGVGEDLHVVAVDAGGKLWHTIRGSAGAWQPTFGSIEGQETNDPGAFGEARCAGVNGELQVCGLLKPTVGWL